MYHLWSWPIEVQILGWCATTVVRGFHRHPRWTNWLFEPWREDTCRWHMRIAGVWSMHCPDCLKGGYRSALNRDADGNERSTSLAWLGLLASKHIVTEQKDHRALSHCSRVQVTLHPCRSIGRSVRRQHTHSLLVTSEQFYIAAPAQLQQRDWFCRVYLAFITHEATRERMRSEDRMQLETWRS